MKRFLVFLNRCEECGHTFETLSDSGDSEMRLLLSKRTHLPAQVMCDVDPAFSELWQIVKATLMSRHISEAQAARLFDRVFGEICDPATDESKFDMTGNRQCPICGSNKIAFGPTEPPIYRELDLPNVTHRKWDALNSKDKQDWVAIILSSL